MKYDGANWTAVSGLGPGSIVRSVQISSLTEQQRQDATPGQQQRSASSSAGSSCPRMATSPRPRCTTEPAFLPFILTNTIDNAPGTIERMFVANPLNFFKSGGTSHLPFHPSQSC